MHKRQLSNKLKPLALVFGATGNQGGSVAHHLAGSGRWRLRLVSRTPASAKAQALLESLAQESLEIEEASVEIVEGDLLDYRSIVQALEDVDAVFLNTVHDVGTESSEVEEKQGLNFVRAVKEVMSRRDCKLHQIVYSCFGLERKHWEIDPKARLVYERLRELPENRPKVMIQDRIRALKVPCVFVSMAWFNENFLTFFAPTRDWRGKLNWWQLPTEGRDLSLHHCPVEDLGGIVCALMENPADYNGRFVQCVAYQVRLTEILDALSRVVGEPIAFRPLTTKAAGHLHLPKEVVETLVKSAEEELPFNFEDDIKLCQTLYPDLSPSFLAWSEKHAFELKAGSPFASILAWNARLAVAEEAVTRRWVMGAAGVLAAALGGLVYWRRKKQ